MKSQRQPAKFLSDLYKDLEDRRLLLPVIALVIAIIAVPLLLSSGGDDFAPAPDAAVLEDEASAVEAAVLTSDAGIRDYRERLENLKKKNPFKQQFVSSPKPEDGAAGSDATATATGTDGFPVPPGLGSAGSDSGSVASGNAPPSELPPGSGATPTEPAPEPETITETKEVTRLITRRIDVMVGAQGDVKEQRGVKELSLLPSKGRPVVAFLGVSEDARHATFAVSADVASTGGSGACIGGGPIACEFLTLKIGQTQSFEYAPDGQTYRLKLLAVEEVEVKARGGSGGEGSGG